MRSSPRLSLVLPLLVFFPTVSALAQTVPRSLALDQVTLVDVRDGTLRSAQTVLIRDDRISSIGASGTVAIPDEARVIDARGGFLIPGLWDMHVHLFNQITRRPPNLWYLPLFVANGVIGVREMWAKTADATTLAEWRRRIRAGTLVGPRIGAAGALVDGPVAWWPTADRVATALEARRFVREADRAGLDFVKVYSNLGREAYVAAVDEARRVGLPVAGHIPLVMSAAEAASARQRSNEHLHQIREACSAGERTILEERTRLYSGPFTTAQDDSLWERHEGMRAESYDPDACTAVSRQLAAAPMWQVPTLINERGYFLGASADFEHDPRLRFVPAEERRIWQEGLGGHGVEIATTSQGDSDEKARRWAATQVVVRALALNGVPFLAGTDLGGPLLYPGFSLHDELALLVEAGLSPLQALQAATLNPARYLEATDSLGTVQAGKLADLVLLDANPLEDITHTQQIRAVVLRGRYLDREALDTLLAEAERFASMSQR